MAAIVAGMVAMGAAGVSPYDSMFGFKRSEQSKPRTSTLSYTPPKYTPIYEYVPPKEDPKYFEAKYFVGDVVNYDGETWTVKDFRIGVHQMEYYLEMEDTHFFSRGGWVWQSHINIT